MIKQKIVQESVYNTNKYKCRTGFVCIGNFDEIKQCHNKNARHLLKMNILSVLHSNEFLISFF